MNCLVKNLYLTINWKLKHNFSLPETIFSGNVGLAISQTLILTGMLQFGVRQTAEVISQMTSVERILQYTHIEREKQWDKGGE